jgi:hypothetical protein
MGRILAQPQLEQCFLLINYIIRSAVEYTTVRTSGIAGLKNMQDSKGAAGIARLKNEQECRKNIAGIAGLKNV